MKHISLLSSLFLLAAIVPAHASKDWTGQGEATGITGNTVYLNDLEDHTWSYYQKNGGIAASYNYNANLCSPDPRNVQITYIGNGVYPDGTAASGVQVSKDEPQHTFVYFETLEKGTDGKYAYSVIPNPFSKRPSRLTDSGSKVYYGCRKWKVTTLTGGKLYNASGTEVAVNGFIDADSDVKFAPSGSYTTNCISMQVVLTAYWEVANRIYISGTDEITYSGLNSTSRDLNFLVLDRTTASTINNGTTPVTVMMCEPDASVDYKNSSNKITSITVGDGDFKVEYANISYPTWTPNPKRKIVDTTYDLKYVFVIGDSENSKRREITLGRGLTTTNSDGFCIPIIRGINVSSKSTLLPNTTDRWKCLYEYLNYRLRIESGQYRRLNYTVGTHAEGIAITYSDGKIYTYHDILNTASIYGILGCDYDRAKEDNDKLKITEKVNLGGRVVFNKFIDSNRESFHLSVLSGKIQSDREPGNARADDDECMYLSTCSANQEHRRFLYILGGEMNNIAGGYDYYSNIETITCNVRMKGGTVKGSVGTGAGSTTGYPRRFVMTGGQVKGWICGGCIGKAISNTGSITGATYLYIGGTGKVGEPGVNKIYSGESGCVFGAGCGNDETTAEATKERTKEQNIDSGGRNAGVMHRYENNDPTKKILQQGYGTFVTVSDNATITNNVYGGGNNGFLETPSHVFILGGTIAGKVFGGCNQNNAVSSDVVMLGGTVKGGIYGGSNSLGTMSSYTNVKVIKGTVGPGATQANIHGGGFGNNTGVTGNATVIIGDNTAGKDNIDYPTIYADIYGGSAEGSTTNSTVSMYCGTVNGDIYGGALGTTSAAATIAGTTAVDIYGGKVVGSVYGGSNINVSMTSTPQIGVTIHDTYQPTEDDPQTYAISNVFGGGNGATPAASGQPGAHDANTNGTFVTVDKGYIENIFGGGNAANVKKTTININKCNPVIGNTYGGCNAANVDGAATTTIWGGTVGNAFAGGNGVFGGKAANVGGNALLAIHGGTIGSAYAGSNNKGTISGTQTVSIDKSAKSGGTQCNESVGEVYGGGNKAEGKAGTINIDCTAENIGDVYGGANQANITTPITLNISVGKINRVFGGNNNSGSISGAVTVNINKSASCSNFSVGTVYGGGNKAAYSAPAGTPNYPEVNILSGTVTNDVFGGGLEASVTGNPVVKINGGTVSRDVYGGGSEASVIGNTSVTLTTGTVTRNIYGGGLGVNTPGSEVAADVSDTATVTINGGSVANVFGCNNKYGAPSTAAIVNVTNGTVTGNVYGGGNLAAATVSPSVTVNGGSMTNVYGGGLGDAAVITGDPSVTINKTASTMTLSKVFGGGKEAAVAGNPTVELKAGSITRAFGGGDEAGITGTTTVKLSGCTVSDAIYGGCNASGTVTQDATIDLTGGSVAGNVHGGGYGAGTNVGGLAKVIMNGASVSAANIYGGGALGTVANTSVLLKNGTVSGDIYGGGLGDNTSSPKVAANVTGASSVSVSGGKVVNVFGCNNLYGGPATGAEVAVSGGTISGNVYGGGNQADASVSPKVSLAGGTVALDVFGGGLLATVTGDPVVEIKGGTVSRDVYGGGSKASVDGSPTVTLTTGTVTRNIYGGGFGDNTSSPKVAADVSGKSKVAVNGGSVVNVFGCNNLYGAPATGAEVTVSGGTVSGNVYGGGNQADASVSPKVSLNGGTVALDAFGGGLEATVTGDPVVEIKGGIVSGDVYGGGSKASVDGNTSVTLTTGTVTGTIYGGGLGVNTLGSEVAADVSGTATVAVNGGSVANVFGCNNKYGTPKKAASVTVTSGTVSGNVYGGGNVAAYTPTASGDYPSVEVSGGAVSGSVFGGGYGDKAKVTSNPNVKLTNGTVNGNIYGGGELAEVKGNTSITVSGGSAKTDVYGGGSKAVITGNTTVSVTAGTVTGDVYGGGYGDNTSGKEIAANVTGSSTVSVSGGKAANVYGCNNKLGAPTTGTTVSVSGSAVVGNVYGGGNVATTTTNPSVSVSGGTMANVFGGGNNAGIGSSTVSVSGGTISTGLYGGCNTTGTASGASVSVTGGTIGADGALANVHGGGYGSATDVQGDVSVTIGNIPSGDDATANKENISDYIIYGDVYGGSALGRTNTASGKKTAVRMYSGTVNGSVYGGALGAVASAATVGATSQTVDIYGGKVTGGVYGGSNINATMTNNPRLGVTVHDTYTPASGQYALGSVFGGGNGETAAAGGQPGAHSTSSEGTFVTVGKGYVGNVFGGGNAATAMKTTVTVSNGTINNIYGGSNKADINGPTSISVSGGSVNTGVYGGCNSKGTVKSDVSVSVTGGSVSGDVHGGGYGSETLVSGLSAVVLDGSSASVSNMYGGGALGKVTNTKVELKSGTVTGDVYGGGLGNVETAADVSQKTIVTVSGGSATNVFGCNNLNGAPQTGAEVTVTSGTISGNVYGGGNLAATTVSPVVAVSGGRMANVFGGGNEAGIGGSTITISDGEITSSVYGGCNAEGTATSSAITITGGEVGTELAGNAGGAVFGGGFGQPTIVSGNVDVNIGTISAGKVASGDAVINGNVYGGSALGKVGTSGVTSNHVNVALNAGSVDGSLFGGGLGQIASGDAVAIKAEVYSPVQVTMNGGTITGDIFGCNNLNGSPSSTVQVDINKTVAGADDLYAVNAVYGGGNKAAYTGTPTLNINSCEVSIGSVYGGGNAASTGGTLATVNGGTIGNVFGGGNGTVSPADVTGGTSLTVNGGTIGNVFAGSNSQGNIGGAMVLNMGTGTGCCALNVTNAYGGGNVAASPGAKITIGCGAGRFTNVYGGAKAADVTKGLTLNIEGGVIDNVFGGNDQDGEIGGDITVNIDNGGCASAQIKNIYGGGNMAAFNHNTVVNLISGIVGVIEDGVLKGGNVFGGGYGAKATVSGDAQVNLISDSDPATSDFVVLGSIYGGGELAQITGSTTLNLAKGTAANAFGGGKQAAVGGSTEVNIKGATVGNVYGGGDMAGIGQSTDVNFTSGVVSGGIYGGCNTTGTVSGDAVLDLTGGTAGTATVPVNIHGGGYGQETAVSGNVDVNLGGTAVYGDVYGGSALGSVNTNTSNHTYVTLASGSVTGNIYGGGLGRLASGDAPAIPAAVNGNVQVAVNGGTAVNVFGCNNYNGAPAGTVSVSVTDGTVSENVYGGGNVADATVSPSVSLTGGTITHDVFGGGLKAKVTGNPTVSLNGGTVSRDIYGGGSQAVVKGNTSVTLTSGTVTGNVYGGGLGDNTSGEEIAANVEGTATVTVNGGTAGSIFGCNNEYGAPTGNVTVAVDMASGTIKGNVYGGGNKAAYTGSSTVNLVRGTVGVVEGGVQKGGSVYGGGLGGSALVKGNPQVSLSGATVCDLYGGGEEAPLEGNPVLAVSGGQAARIFGGGNNALVTGNPNVTISAGTHGTVFGGGNNANVKGAPTVSITGSSTVINGNVFGGGNNGDVSGSPKVTIGTL